MKNKGFRIIIIMLAAASLLPAENVDREYIFKQGVSAYAAENYDKAISVFSKILSSGKISWELYYNLGNAYFRQGELGDAILYWEKAKLLAPSQSDIIHNLAVAEQLLVDKVVLPDMFPLFRWYEQLQERLPLNAAIMLIGFLIFLMILIILLLRHKNKGKKETGSAAYITVLSVFMALILMLSTLTITSARQRKNEKYAVILASEVHVLSEPDKDATVLFILHEGSKVKVNKNIEDSWSNISYFDDKVGWLPRSAIGVIEQ